MAGITKDGPHVVTDEWVLGQAGILDVANDDQVPGQPMFSGPDFLSDHTFSEAMPSERSSATRTDDLSSNASRANRSQGRGSNRPGHDDSVSGRDDDESGIAPGAQSSSFPELMNIGQSEIRDSRGSSRPVPTSSIAFQVSLTLSGVSETTNKRGRVSQTCQKGSRNSPSHFRTGPEL